MGSSIFNKFRQKNKEAHTSSKADPARDGTAADGERRQKEVLERFAADPQNPRNAQDYLLYIALPNAIDTPSVIEEDSIRYPALQLTIIPHVADVQDHKADLTFHALHPTWEYPLYEYSAGLGSDARQAVSMAAELFIGSFLQGVVQLLYADAPHYRVTSTFAGREHRWRVSSSNIIGIGNSTEKIGEENPYWECLKEGICRRLGNQKLVYVKVYAAKAYGEAIGECRINDIQSPELSALAKSMAERWSTDRFSSHKAFFFLEQEQETLLPSPYTGSEGRAKYRQAVHRAVEMFHAANTQEEYDTLPQRLIDALGDATLADACYSFLPEICAEHHFEECPHPETLMLDRGRGEIVTVYKQQLADYYPLMSVLFEFFNRGVFGEQTSDIYREYIGVSAFFSALRSAQADGDGKLSDIQGVATIIRVGEDFELR